MTHDPLCKSSKAPAGYGTLRYYFEESDLYWKAYHCQCDLIAKVRDDERSRIADAVAENMIAYPYEYPSDYAEADRRWIKAGCPMPGEKP